MARHFTLAEYDRFCPISLGSEVLADRWTPLILRELIIGSTRFNDIARGLPNISRSRLSQRLRHLERKGVVERWPAPGGRGSEYRLTPAGKDLEQVVMALGLWAVQWLYQDIDPDGIDAVTLMWWMHRHIDSSELPPGRVVVQFDHTAPERTSIWVVLDRGEPSVCVQHPGFDADVVVVGTTRTLGEVFSGMTTWRRALADGALRAEGAPHIIRHLPRWFGSSPFAAAVHTASRRHAAPG